MHNRSGNSPRRTARYAGGVLVAAAALTLSACSSGGSSDSTVVDAPQGSQGAQHNSGIRLDTPYQKPDVTLTDTNGEQYDLRKETQGKPTLLYFGYSHCPDACPAIMSNIDQAKRELPAKDRKRLQVVFVTTDPKRDTAKHLGEWLDAQSDGHTVGLTGKFDTIQQAAKDVHVGIAPTYKKKNGDIISSHGKNLLMFSPKDDKAHYMYTDDKTATPENLSKDLPKLVKGATP